MNPRPLWDILSRTQREQATRCRRYCGHRRLSRVVMQDGNNQLGCGPPDRSSCHLQTDRLVSVPRQAYGG